MDYVQNIALLILGFLGLKLRKRSATQASKKSNEKSGIYIDWEAGTLRGCGPAQSGTFRTNPHNRGNQVKTRTITKNIGQFMYFSKIISVSQGNLVI